MLGESLLGRSTTPILRKPFFDFTTLMRNRFSFTLNLMLKLTTRQPDSYLSSPRQVIKCRSIQNSFTDEFFTIENLSGFRRNFPQQLSTLFRLGLRIGNRAASPPLPRLPLPPLPRPPPLSPLSFPRPPGLRTRLIVNFVPFFFLILLVLAFPSFPSYYFLNSIRLSLISFISSNPFLNIQLTSKMRLCLFFSSSRHLSARCSISVVNSEIWLFSCEVFLESIIEDLNCYRLNELTSPTGSSLLNSSIFLLTSSTIAVITCPFSTSSSPNPKTLFTRISRPLHPKTSKTVSSPVPKSTKCPSLKYSNSSRKSIDRYLSSRSQFYEVQIFVKCRKWGQKIFRSIFRVWREGVSWRWRLRVQDFVDVLWVKGWVSQVQFIIVYYLIDSQKQIKIKIVQKI